MTRGITCDLCGTRLARAVALNSHYGSKPCKLARTEREMRERDWKPCWVSDAAYVLDEAEIEHEHGPAEYNKGGMYTERTVANQQQQRLKRHFQHPRLNEAEWCPAWAQPVVELNIPSLKRIEILRHVKMNVVARVHTIGTILALGGVEALALMSVPAEPDDDTEECESATQEPRKPAL